LVNEPIGFWFRVSVNWWDDGSLEVSVVRPCGRVFQSVSLSLWLSISFWVIWAAPCLLGGMVGCLIGGFVCL
jgi:hypothetical protein